MPDTARHAVFGHPVAHSLSPQLHAAFGQLTGIPLAYDAIDAEPERFDAALAAFLAAGGRGANVTLPLKTQAYALCATHSARAVAVGAVNTLLHRDGAWHGDNTDGAGLVRDLTERHGLDLRGRRTLLLGAGGAARGVAAVLMDAGVDALYVVNRTGAHADALVDMLGEPARAHARYLEDLPTLGEFQLIVQATSATRGGALPDLPRSLVGLRTACVDLNYGEAAIPFLAWARAAGAHDVVDGLGMLVEQAAESFQLWHGVRPPTDGVYARLLAGESLLVTAD